MMKRLLFATFILLMLSGCAIMQSVVKSTFPYTTTVVVPQSSAVGVVLSATGAATSFDQNLKKDGNTADKVHEVHIVSASLQSKTPSDFNIGNLLWVKVYLSKADNTDEILVASRTDITPLVGNSIVLDVDNSNLLDEYVHEQKVNIRMVYQLRNHIDVNANLHLALGIGVFPAN